jgi:hypothetical protein
VIPGGVHHIEGGEVDATDGAAPATDAAVRLREEPEIIGVDAEARIQGAEGRAKNPPFCFVSFRFVPNLFLRSPVGMRLSGRPPRLISTKRR